MEEFVVGQRVCIRGHGGDGMVHEHATVERLTRTLIITPYRRHRRDDLHSVPYRPYGGTTISGKCQEPKRKRFER